MVMLEGTSNVSRRLVKAPPEIPSSHTSRASTDTNSRAWSSIVFEWQVDELKRKGLLRRPVPIAFDWHDQMFYGDSDSEMVNGTRPKDGSSRAYQYLTASILVDGKRLTIVLTPIKSRKHMLEYVEDALNRIKEHGDKGEASSLRRRILLPCITAISQGARVLLRDTLHTQQRDEWDWPERRRGGPLSLRR